MHFACMQKYLCLLFCLQLANSPNLHFVIEDPRNKQFIIKGKKKERQSVTLITLMIGYLQSSFICSAPKFLGAFFSLISHLYKKSLLNLAFFFLIFQMSSPSVPPPLRLCSPLFCWPWMTTPWTGGETSGPGPGKPQCRASLTSSWTLSRQIR